jgi:hypothetical protein
MAVSVSNEIKTHIYQLFLGDMMKKRLYLFALMIFIVSVLITIVINLLLGAPLFKTVLITIAVDLGLFTASVYIYKKYFG